MRIFKTAFLAISFVVFVCVSEEIIARDDANHISISDNRNSIDHGEAYGGDVAEQTWIPKHCRAELKDKEDNDCLLHVPHEAANEHIRLFKTRENIHEIQNLRKAIDSQLWFINWFGSLGESTTRRKLISSADKISISAPSFAFGSAPGPAPTPDSYDLVAPSSPPSQDSSSSTETPKNSNLNPTKEKHGDTPSQSDPSLPSKQKTSILKELIIAVTSTAVLTFILVALLFLFCFRRNRNNAVDPRNGPRDEGPLLHLVDVSTDTSENSHDAAAASTGKKMFGANSKRRSFLSRVSLKRFGQDSSPTDASSSGLPPLKYPPGRSPPPPQPSESPPPPPPPPPKAPPPPPPKPKPPPPPKLVRPPPAPPKAGARKDHSSSVDGSDVDSETGAPKTKLKPFFWDKMANPDQKMVWHEISAGSFQFNEEKMESLFCYNDANKTAQKGESSRDSPVQYIQIIDTRKAQNLSILLRALNVTTEEVVDAIKEGNELPVELLQTMLKMAPTSEEELKLRLYSGDLNLLGPAERFLKILVDIPFAFKRIESLLFMISLQEEVCGLKEALGTLEVASKKLRNSRLFLKLLEAVLKTGNRMNVGTFRGEAQAFKLDTLLKLSDVKGADGKTTLLHFVVLEIIRSEGVRALRLKSSSRSRSRSFSSVKTDDSNTDSTQESVDHYRSIGLEVVSGLATELEDVKRAAIIDVDGLAATLTNISGSLTSARDFLKTMDEESDFERALAGFIERADTDIKWLKEEEERIMVLVKSSADYFHGKSTKTEGLRLFAIVRDFLIMLEKVCKEVKKETIEMTTTTTKTTNQTDKKESESHEPSTENIRERLFPAITERRVDSSDDDSDNSEDEEN